MNEKKIFIVIPTLNEAENIKELIENIFSLDISGLNVLVVDDDSKDGTDEIVKSLSIIYIV